MVAKEQTRMPERKAPEEPLLTDGERRLSVFPIKHHDLYAMYKKHFSMFWTVEEVHLADDLEDWSALTEPEQTFIKMILAFFAVADGLVNVNLGDRFINEITLVEARLFYEYQTAVENVHNIMYCTLIDTYIDTDAEKLSLYNSIENYPVIAQKCDWCVKWSESDSSLAQRLAAFAIVEGVFFSGSFCAIFWIKSRDLMPGLCLSNEFISKDEGAHVEFAALLYNKYIVNKLTTATIHEMVDEAVEIECGFIESVLPQSFGIMNQTNMKEYIKYTADQLLIELNYPILYLSLIHI
jgi:ribonucleotide reductase beta subunit family protein with ferritin-like domain